MTHLIRDMTSQEAYPASSGRVCEKCGTTELCWGAMGSSPKLETLPCKSAASETRVPEHIVKMGQAARESLDAAVQESRPKGESGLPGNAPAPASVASAARHPAAFINALSEEGSKDELLYWLQRTWDDYKDQQQELIDLRLELAKASAPSAIAQPYEPPPGWGLHCSKCGIGQGNECGWPSNCPTGQNRTDRTTTKEKA